MSESWVSTEAGRAGLRRHASKEEEHGMTERVIERMISVRQAAARGISKLRLDNWANPQDHFEFYLVPGGGVGPWVKLWSPTNEPIGMPNPQTLLITMMGDLDDECWLPYAEEAQP